MAITHSGSNAARGSLVIDGVNLVDLSSRWLNTNCDESNGCDGTDIDGSGVIDTADLNILSDYWFDID